MRIAFLNRVVRPFNGLTGTQAPLGGTQSALIYLAQALQARGHEVHVFCNCGPLAGVFAGVTYHPVLKLARFAREFPLDVFVPVADDISLQLGIPARFTLWWGHNDYSYLWQEMPDLRADIAARLGQKADRVAVVSQWQADLFANLFGLPREHLFVTHNGVHAPYFSQEAAPANPPRLIYSSAPDRGLDILLNIFPAIRAQVPEAELHLYSSFKVWGKDEAFDQKNAGALYAQARSLEGVFLHNPLPHPELAQALRQGSIWLYPNHATPIPDETGFYAETSCIAALEAQAAGLPVITSARGALPETVSDGILITGDVYQPEIQAQFVQAAIELLQNPAERARIGQQARERILRTGTWDTIAAEWEQHLEGAISTRVSTPPITTPFATPHISVIIPTYNRARNLAFCLESLTWQESLPFEVIVCDDGSSDNTREVVEQFRTRLNVRYRYQEDLGFRAAAARNIGTGIARGKLLVYLDSDLVVPPTFLQAHWDAHQQDAKVVVNSYVYRMIEEVDDDLGLPPDEYITKHRDILKPDSRDRYQIFEREEPLEENYFLDSNALSLMASDMQALGGFDPAFIGWGHEDTELGYRAAGYKMRLKLIKERATAYHIYHYVAPTKDQERAVNWKILTDKYGIQRWYNPLWDLPVTGAVWIQQKGEPVDLPIFGDAEWELKTGHPISHAPWRLHLQVHNGILEAITHA